MKKLIALILFPFLLIPFGAKANDNFSVEIEALTLVMEQYKDDSVSKIELDDNNKNVLYLPAFGDLTGGYPCKKSFKKWAIVSEEEIIEIKSQEKS